MIHWYTVCRPGSARRATGRWDLGLERLELRRALEFLPATWRIEALEGAAVAQATLLRENPEQAPDLTLLAATDDLNRDHFVSNPSWTELSKHYSERQCMDVVFTAGQYTQVSMILNSFGIQLDDGQTLDPDLKAF